MKYSDKQRLQKIYETAVLLQQSIIEQGITKEDILNDYRRQWFVTTPLYHIGEQVYNLSDEYKKEHPDVPWLMIAGLRHRLVHDYDGTNWNIIVEVLFDELPILIEQIRKLI